MPPRVAVDTNVLVSYLLSGNARGAAAGCVERVAAVEWVPVSSTATWLEYEDVLRRPELDLDDEAVTEFLDALAGLQEWHAPSPSPARADDPADQLWLDLLSGSKADALVTYNLRDFRSARGQGLRVLKPADALRQLQER